MLGDAIPPNWAKILTSVLAGTLLFYLPFTIWFYLNRRIHPIRGRMPRVVLLLNFSMYLLASQSVLTAVLAEKLPCVIRNWSAGLLATSVLAIYAYRLTRVLFAYEITKNIMELQKLQNKVDWKENWYTRHRNLLRPKEGMIFGIGYIAYNVLFLIFITIQGATDYGTMASCPDIQDTAHASEAAISEKVLFDQVVAYLYIFILGICLFRKHGDAFYLRTEFIWTLGACLLTIVLYFVWSFLRLGPYIGFLLMATTLHIMFITGTVMPYYLSVKSKNIPTAISFELYDIITTPNGFTAFLEYLQLEFSAENLLFWGEIQMIKNMLNSSQTLLPSQVILLKEIYQKFIAIGAPCQITISAALVYEISAGLQKEDEDIFALISLFEQAQSEIYQLMKSDSFLRFQQTGEYQKVKQNLTSDSKEKKVSSQLALSVAEMYAYGIFDPLQSTKRSTLTSVQSSSRQPHCVAELEFESLQQHPEELTENGSPKSSVDDT